MIITTELIQDLTFTLAKDEYKYIKINGNITTCIMSVSLLDAGALVTIAATVESDEYFLTVPAHEDITWELFKLNGIELDPINVDIESVVFTAPSMLYV